MCKRNPRTSPIHPSREKDHPKRGAHSINVKFSFSFQIEQRITERITSTIEQKENTKIYLGKTSHGEENPAKLSLYRIQPSTV